jgi:hypothetical protein
MFIRYAHVKSLESRMTEVFGYIVIFRKEYRKEMFAIVFFSYMLIISTTS